MTIRRAALRDNHVSRPQSGPPRKLTEEHRDHLYDITTHQNPHATNHDLLESIDHVVKLRAL